MLKQSLYDNFYRFQDIGIHLEVYHAAEMVLQVPRHLKLISNGHSLHVFNKALCFAFVWRQFSSSQYKRNKTQTLYEKTESNLYSIWVLESIYLFSLLIIFNSYHYFYVTFYERKESWKKALQVLWLNYNSLDLWLVNNSIQMV